MTLPYYIQFVLAFLAALCFAIVFNCPKKECFTSGIGGGIAWVIYVYVYHRTTNAVIGIFVASLFAAAFSRFFSYRHMEPSTVFLLPSIVPLVPGSAMYRTMKGILDSNIYSTFMEATKAIKFAGVIAIAIMIVFVLPYSFFAIGKQKKPKF